MSDQTPEPAGQPTGLTDTGAGAPAGGDTTANVPAVTDPTLPANTGATDVPSPTPDATEPNRSHGVGDLVTHTYFDVYAGAGGEETTVYGIVVDHRVADVDDGKGGTVQVPQSRVFWLRDLSDPVNDAELSAVEQ